MGEMIPFPVWIIPFPVLNISFEPLGSNEKKKVFDQSLKVGEIIPFPV